MKYKFLPDIATADIAFEAEAETLEELFTACALALEDSMVDLKGVEEKETKIIELESKDIERLLFDWLGELIFLKDSEDLLFSKFNITIKEDKLKAECIGEKINKHKHELKNDVKAVTLHRFKVEESKHGWKASVILD
ncbi:archease, partial [Candidatus Woesearchaeota archaeon]|nr:archease [Candidatus Woesearchaeota archaeon]